MMLKRNYIYLIAIAVVMGFAGCQEAQTASTAGRDLAAPADSISIYNLCGQLGLKVTEQSGTFIKLANSSNTVLIFTYTDGAVFVNQKQIGTAGIVATIEGIPFVSANLVERIKSALTKTTLRPNLWRTPVRANGTVVIDPGHGGRDPGAISCRGCYEKSVNLDISRKLADYLRRAGVDVIMTRMSDEFIELDERAEIANQHGADLFVSIHADSNPDSARQGYTIYIARAASRQSEIAAEAIAVTMGNTGQNSHGIARADYRVLVRTRCPAVLVETGYLSNFTEAGLLTQPDIQQRIARAISDGIIRSLSRF